MSDQREMTLDEWANRLSEFHLVNKQYQQLKQRIEKLERKLQLEEELNHVAEGGFTQLSTTVKEQKQQIIRLEQTLRDLGYCTVCSSVPEHHIDEPFSSCNCGTSEDYATRPLQKAQRVQQHNIELVAMVKQLRAALGHLHHNAKASGAEMGLALDVAEEALELSPQSSLAEHDAITIAKAIKECGDNGKAVRMEDGYYLSESFLWEYVERIKNGDL